LARRLPPGTKFGARSYFLRVFFYLNQAKDLRQIRVPPNLTSGQSAAKLAACVEVCAQPILDSRDTRRRSATNLSCGAVRANNRLCEIEKAEVRSRLMGCSAPRIGRPRRFITMVDHQIVECEFGIVGHLKNPLSIASRWGRRPEAFPKTATYCHLLRLWSRKAATPVSTVPFVTCPARACRPTWARAENRERGREKPR
jgi:hypothetical protein